MNRYGKRCVLYPRVSTEMQVDGYSLEGQKNMLTRFADREEMIIVDTYEDAGKSGKSIEGRPAFQKMLRDIEDGLDIDYILVYKLSRFGRNAADILNSLELVQSYGVNLICIEEGIDSSQTSGKLLISVLSAVAEIERENIIEQTMNGRREKARQGGWNGGFAPYGYTLEDNKLMIEETEAVAIRKIFELYTSSEIGLGGIANQLNLQGIRKIPRQNGTLEDWTGHFIKLILDNPVYCGKIAYGRRTKEKVKGTKNDYQMKRNDDYILTEGQHKGIVSEEVWEKAHAKRLRTGVKQPSKIGRDRVHLLSGLLKCPVCGSPMYTNKHAWTNKDGTYKEIYYYVCSRNRMVRGKHCEYKAMLKKTDIEPMVIEAIREIVRNEEYAQAIKKRIGVQIDTKAVDKELEGYQAKLKEVDLNKTRLEREIDSLPADAKYRERKLHDMTLRLDSLYDVIVELEEKIEDARLRRDAIKQQAITLENIYKIMVNFDCVYNIINDEEKRNVVTALIKEIEIYRNDESEYPLKRIGLNFPVFKDGGEVTELLWDKGNTVETNDIAGFVDIYQQACDLYSSISDKLPDSMKELYEMLVRITELENMKDLVICLNKLSTATRGFGLYTITSENGKLTLDTLTRDGFGDPFNHGLRAFAANDEQGWMVIGTANPFMGTQLWRTTVDMTDPMDRFTDLDPNGWAYPSIEYCVRHGLMSGMSDTIFSPNTVTTRAQLVQVLYNFEGKPDVSDVAVPFTDAASGWYRDAVAWAYKTGVVDGMSPTTFAPNNTVTREQVAVILMRYLTKVCGVERTWTPDDLSGFADGGNVSGWARAGMADAVALGLFGGSQDSSGQVWLRPGAGTTRAETAALLQRMCTKVLGIG